MFLMRDEKEGRKKQARSNKQTRQSNTAHPHIYINYTCIYIYIYINYIYVNIYIYMYIWSHEGESWYHKRSVTPISVLKAGHVEHLPQYIYIFYHLWISISLSLF